MKSSRHGDVIHMTCNLLHNCVIKQSSWHGSTKTVQGMLEGRREVTHKFNGSTKPMEGVLEREVTHEWLQR